MKVLIKLLARPYSTAYRTQSGHDVKTPTKMDFLCQPFPSIQLLLAHKSDLKLLGEIFARMCRGSSVLT